MGLSAAAYFTSIVCVMEQFRKVHRDGFFSGLEISKSIDYIILGNNLVEDIGSEVIQPTTLLFFYRKVSCNSAFRCNIQWHE